MRRVIALSVLTILAACVQHQYVNRPHRALMAHRYAIMRSAIGRTAFRWRESLVWAASPVKATVVWNLTLVGRPELSLSVEHAGAARGSLPSGVRTRP